MIDIHIEKFRPGQEDMVYQLIKKVYDEFVAGDYTEEGNKVFYDWIDPARIAERQNCIRCMWIAFSGNKPVGMIEIRENKHISLLFVDKEYQQHGIGRQLFRKALQDCIRKDPSLDKFYVHASPFSIPAYQKLGFIGIDEMQEEFGIKYLPMEITLD